MTKKRLSISGQYANLTSHSAPYKTTEVKIVKIFLAIPSAAPTRKLAKRATQVKFLLESIDHEVINPLELPLPTGGQDIEVLAERLDRDEISTEWIIEVVRDVWDIAKCDAIYLMQGWENCPIAIIARIIAENLEMFIWTEKNYKIFPRKRKPEDTGAWLDKQIRKDINTWFVEQMGKKKREEREEE